MSRLEGATKSVLSPMVNPELSHVLVRLNANQQKLTAFWANLKAVCLELSHRQAIRGYSGGFVAPGQFNWLHDHGENHDRTPPSSTQV